MGVNDTVTVVVAARNASSTIEKAIESINASGLENLLLVDDFSEDETVLLAKRCFRGNIRVVRPKVKRGLGNARQTGLDAVETEYLMWLDADDELLPGRAEYMFDELQRGADIVFDEAELFSGETGERIRPLPIPFFLYERNGIYRLFERNYLPGPAWPALRTNFARRIGYDVSLPTGDDLDFNLRALVAGGNFRLLPLVGYRQYAYDDSLSRDLSLQRGAVSQVLSKYDYQEVMDLFEDRGIRHRQASWTIISMAIFRCDYSTALEWLGREFVAEMTEIENGLGACSTPESWRVAFTAGTLYLLVSKPGAEKMLRAAELIFPSAECANNLGVAFSKSGRLDESRLCFELAIERNPGYRDALVNLRDLTKASEITTHPLRREPVRNDYRLGLL